MLTIVSAVSPAWSAAVPLNPDARNQHFMLYNKHSTAIVEYSFDGVTLEGQLDPADGTRGKVFDNRKHADIYFRIKTGSTGPATIDWDSWQGGAS